MQSPVYKARLAGAADPGNANELSERQLKVYILKVMSRRALYFESLAVSRRCFGISIILRPEM